MQEGLAVKEDGDRDIRVPPPAVRRTRRFPAGTGKGGTSWYSAVGKFYISTPPDGLRGIELGDIYVHYNVETRRTQLWYFDQDGRWQPTEVGDEHPVWIERRLQMRDNGEPSWVKSRSLSSMQSRARTTQAFSRFGHESWSSQVVQTP
ncbi:hypothetical protein DENSPDRAFT_855342 [Dentipellis sp. KUC8613]|nr:hypothetical protein DENSPDRAFT_855342 [Dentipellis sp. KUC8613]